MAKGRKRLTLAPERFMAIAERVDKEVLPLLAEISEEFERSLPQYDFDRGRARTLVKNARIFRDKLQVRAQGVA